MVCMRLKFCLLLLACFVDLSLYADTLNSNLPLEKIAPEFLQERFIDKRSYTQMELQNPSTHEVAEHKESRFGITTRGSVNSGYSELELNQNSFQENEIEAALWRAGVGYNVYYEFRPFTHTTINLFFGTSIEITQYRTGGKKKPYNDGIYHAENAYDWGDWLFYGNRVNNIGVAITLYKQHKIYLILRQAFLDNFDFSYLGLSLGSNFLTNSRIMQEGIGAGIAAFNNTQILLNYTLDF
ncbi:hypothetical protein CCY97_05510 [Helicobacter sp. 10-6591]|nr:hypothetical protein CCY97_05510 [Helicobacter sp. 10-6591]